MWTETTHIIVHFDRSRIDAYSILDYSSVDKSPPEYKALRCGLEILEIAEIAYFASAVVQCKMSIEVNIAGLGNFKWGGWSRMTQWGLPPSLN